MNGTAESAPPLVQIHLRELRRSSIGPHTRAARGYRSVDRDGAKKAGFTGAQARSGLLVPMYGPAGELVQVQLKPDRPRTKEDGRVLKYETPFGSRIRLDFPSRVRVRIKDRKTDLWVTEGMKKTDALASRALACIGLTGVDCWNVPEDWAHVPLRGRRVNVVYDNDVMRKPEVYRSLQRITKFLEGKRARVYWVFLPDGEDKVGVDDYLAAGHTVEDLLSLARPSPTARAAAVRRAAARARAAGHQVGPHVGQGEAEQEEALRQLVKWWKSGRRDLRFGGLAGTGKTTVIAKVADLLGLTGLEVLYAAYTGKATRVLGGKLRDAGVVGSVSTLHGLFKIPRTMHCGMCPSREEATPCHGTDRDCGCRSGFISAGVPIPGVELLIVDESSMVDDDFYSEIVKVGYRTIFFGDPGQLPPFTSALDLMKDPDIFLSTPFRQQHGSAILDVAYAAREGKTIRYGKHGAEVVKVRQGQPASQIRWEDNPMVLCNSNEHRAALNAKARRAAGRGPTPEPGDKVVCLKNNRRRGIDNGMLGVVKDIRRLDDKRYRATIELETGDRYVGLISSSQFGRQDTLKEMRGVDLWDYAYALTVYKAQGSQADNVVLFDAPWMEKDPEQYRRWLYTGITRAAKHLTIVR